MGPHDKNHSVFNTVALIDPSKNTQTKLLEDSNQNKKINQYDTNTRNASLRRNNQTETYSHQPTEKKGPENSNPKAAKRNVTSLEMMKL